METTADLYEKCLPLAEQILGYARDSILVNYRFLSIAVSALEMEPQKGCGGLSCDGRRLYYDPVFLLREYKREPAFAVRSFLHVLFHMIFSHGFSCEKVEGSLWDLAADLAVENTILELEFPNAALARDESARQKLRALSEDVSALTAERLYRYFRNHPMGETQMQEYRSCFYVDSHMRWLPERKEELVISMEQWRKISERVQADLKSFSRGGSNSESLQKNLAESTRDRYDYGELLRRFMVRNEDMQINDDEFDYIYYTYGLERYGNMPLVEPLEYRDSKKIREFVIAIDTSASCRGDVVQSFLQKTYAILKGEDNFFRKMNVHIIQCDNQVQKDTKITCREEFDHFIATEKLLGFGSTDFRPVFSHVEELLAKREFENLKGLIYFTDGYGVYPERMPPYEVMFVFVDQGEEGPRVPPWAIRVLLDGEALEE